MHPKEEKTLIILKPDALQRHVLGEIIHRFERKGLNIVGMKMTKLEDVVLDDHYSHLSDKPFFKHIKSFMMSAPVVLMVLSGMNAISAVRTIVGGTNASEAQAGTIRGDFAISSAAANMVHASDSPENAEIEVERFFTEDELFTDHRRPDFEYVYTEDERG